MNARVHGLMILIADSLLDAQLSVLTSHPLEEIFYRYHRLIMRMVMLVALAF